VEYGQNPSARRAEAESFQAPPQVPRTTPATVEAKPRVAEHSDPICGSSSGWDNPAYQDRLGTISKYAASTTLFRSSTFSDYESLAR
jgi:hypothetical protein